MRGSATLIAVLTAILACDDELPSADELFYPRNLVIESEPRSGERYLHLTGMGDGSLRIFQLGQEPPLKLVQKFAAANTIGADEGYTFTATTGLDGAWGLALSPLGDHLYLGSLWANQLTHFERPDALSWNWAGTVRDQDLVRGDRPLNVDGLYGIKDVAVTPDGRYLYTAGGKDNGIGVFRLKDGLPIYEAFIPGIDGAFEIATTTTAGGYLLHVLGARNAPSARTLCMTGGASELTLVRHLAFPEGATIEVLQRIRGGFADEFCVNQERELEDCLSEHMEVSAMRGASDLELTKTASGADVILVPARCTNAVVRFERTTTGLLAMGGSHVVPAPWPAAEEGAPACGTEDADRDEIYDACDLSLNAVLAKNDLIYAFSGDGGFVDVFSSACFTTTSTACTEASVCIDVTDGDCKIAPGPERLGSHPFEAIFDGDVIYVSLDQESAVGVIDVAADGTPKLRTIFDAR
jgi:hypothetical protein